MKRKEVLDTTRHFMMLDDRTDPREVVSHNRPMCRDYMIQTLNHNHPRWQQIPGLETEVETLIAESYKKHHIPEDR